MNVKSVDIRDMIWMENSEFHDDWYCVIFMVFKKSKRIQNRVCGLRYKVRFMDQKDTLKFQNNAASGKEERKFSEGET